MKTLALIKPLYYSPGVSAFIGYRNTALGLSDPDISPSNQKNMKKNTLVFCSSAQRSISTARQFGYKNIRTSNLLNEVLFDLSNLVSQAEFDKYGSELVRRKFIDAFIDNSLIESRYQLQHRIYALINLLKSYPYDEYICFSHSFFMKILEAHVKSDYSLFDNPQLIRNYIKEEESTYPYGTGVTLKL